MFIENEMRVNKSEMKYVLEVKCDMIMMMMVWVAGFAQSRPIRTVVYD